MRGMQSIAVKIIEIQIVGGFAIAVHLELTPKILVLRATEHNFDKNTYRKR